MVTSSPDVSVVIPTIPSSDHSRVASLLRNQDFSGGIELIVVNDSSLNICEARNHGLQRSKAPIVAITDDDTVPPADWVGSIFEAFQKNPGLTCVEGSVTGGLNYHGSRKYIGCNVAVRKQAAMDIGGWSDRYAGWRDDTEFGWRMEKESDGECAFIESIRMIHPQTPRTPYDHELETLLKEEYPSRYAEIIDTGLQSKIWRYAQRTGIVSHLNTIRDRISG